MLHSKQALTLSLVKDGAETGEKAEVPADSNYFFYAGDNKTYVDFRLEDGREFAYTSRTIRRMTGKRDPSG